MKYRGIWNNNSDNEKIELQGPLGGDSYRLSYNYKDNDFEAHEDIHIFINDANSAHVPHSQKFGRTAISVINDDVIEICGNVFERESK
jgi:hypothetical protein